MRKVGEESSKTYELYNQNGFFARFMSGKGCELGPTGYLHSVVTILDNCDGFDLGTPGYDGKHIPVQDNYYDYVYNSHVLEHIEDFQQALQEWYRVVKVGGYIVITVPHKFLYEKKLNLPSNYNGDHKRFYTPSTLLLEVELSLKPNSYRVRYLEDNDRWFDYSIPPDKHSGGCYELVLVLQKIKEPTWEIK